MTQAEIYDWLLTHGVLEPACVMLGTRCVVGRWIDASEHTGSAGNGAGYICRVGRVAIHVLGEGDTWDEAHAAAKARLA
jgi:hypothetical protein